MRRHSEEFEQFLMEAAADTMEMLARMRRTGRRPSVCDYCGCYSVRHRWRNGMRICLNGDGCVWSPREMYGVGQTST